MDAKAKGNNKYFYMLGDERKTVKRRQQQTLIVNGKSLKRCLHVVCAILHVISNLSIQMKNNKTFTPQHARNFVGRKRASNNKKKVNQQRGRERIGLRVWK